MVFKKITLLQNLLIIIILLFYTYLNIGRIDVQLEGYEVFFSSDGLDDSQR